MGEIADDCYDRAMDEYADNCEDPDWQDEQMALDRSRTRQHFYRRQGRVIDDFDVID
jgi:hypothetical protein